MLTPNGLPTTAWFEWGSNKTYGQMEVLPTPYDGAAVQRVSVTTAALLAGSVYHFRLGASNASGVVYGSDQMFRVATGGKLAAWGGNTSGEAFVPAGLSNIVALIGGYNQSYAVRADGTVRRWGRIPPGTEMLETALSNVVTLAASYGHVLVLQSDGNVKAYGTSTATNVPAGLSNVVAIAAGGSDGIYFSLATRANGTVVAWGANSSGQTTIPASLTNGIAVAAGMFHSLALKSDGKVVAWGSNSYGQTNVPAGLNNVVAISAAGFHNRVLRADGTVLAWGDEYFSPYGVSNFVAIAAGLSDDVALGANGRITALSYYGDPAVPSGLSNAVLVASGGAHFLAIGHNAAPSVNGIVTWTFPNTDRTVQIPLPFDANNDPVQLHVKSPPSSGSLYQYASGARGLPIVASGTPVTDPLRRVIYSPPPNSRNDVYGAFGYSASDGELDSITSYATMQIFLPTAPQLSVFRSKPTSGDFELNFTGEVGATYRVWVSTNLTQWEVLDFAAPTSNGWFQIIDPNAATWPQRFYRAGSP
jgi:alpha-tubulin suppressor-like RCC1 family protein